MPLIRCVVCETTRGMPAAKSGAARMPQGWKSLGDQPHCSKCKQTGYALRAVIAPVSGPVDRPWGDLREELRALWIESTRCANWIMTELYARDVRRQPDDDRLPAMAHVYLYPEARVLFPRLPAQAVAALVHTAQRRYRADRFALLWSRTASLATYRYPVAFTVPTQAWSLREQEGRWIVSVRLSDSRWRLLLRGGPGMRRQASKLSQLVSGDAERGPLEIYQLPGPGGGRTSSNGGTRVMVKIAAWLPKIATGERSDAITVRTDAESLLCCQPRWRIDPAPIRGVLAAEARRRASLLTNLSAARRARGSRPGGIEAALSELSRRSRQRLAEACRTYAAQLAAHVASRGAGVVHYDDRVRPELTHFPWEQLRRRLAEKLDDRGIRFVHLNTECTDQPVAGETRDDHAA